MKIKCRVNGCNNNKVSKGLCRKHYKRMIRGNDPNTPSREELTLAERFREKLGPEDPVTGCIEWRGCQGPKGHGGLWHKGTMVGAHRLAYELVHGPIPEGLWVLHHCDNPPCCNPDHLFLGTHLDNMADMRAKGRSLVGSNNWRAKLTEDDALSIQRRLATGELQITIAKSFGVSQATISCIKVGKSWRHVKLETK